MTIKPVTKSTAKSTNIPKKSVKNPSSESPSKVIKAIESSKTSKSAVSKVGSVKKSVDTVKTIKKSESLIRASLAQTHAFTDNVITIKGARTHNLQNIDITMPKNKLITITGVSGSGKSSLAFHTIYKEGQYRYIESLSSYLRQFFNLGARPELDSSVGLSPAIAIEQNKRVGNIRSTVGTLTEIDDYLRLLYAKLGDIYSYGSGKPIKAQSIDQIIADIRQYYLGHKVFIVQQAGTYDNGSDFMTFVTKNRKKVEAGKGFTRYLILSQQPGAEPIEYFYLESPNIPQDYYPVQTYGVFDRLTIEESKLPRLKEDIVKILSSAKKFGVYSEVHGEWGIVNSEGGNEDQREIKKISKKSGLIDLAIDNSLSIELKQQDKALGRAKKTSKNNSSDFSDFVASSDLSSDTSPDASVGIRRFTDKYYCPDYDIEYPDFQTHHFSPNRAEGACPVCHGLGEILEIDLMKVIDPLSKYSQAILPWRDSTLGQTILKKLAQKYAMDEDKLWKDLPERFTDVVMNGDDELLRLGLTGQYMSMTYKGVKDVLTGQYHKGILTVDFQAMFDMVACHECGGSKLRKESLYVYLHTGKPQNKPHNIKTDDMSEMVTIFDLQKIPMVEMIKILEMFESNTDKPVELIERILGPLLDRARTINNLGLGYINISRPIDTLSGGEIQRLRLAKQLGNKLTGIIYVLDEPTIGLDTNEIIRVIASIRQLQQMGNTIIVVEHNEEFIRASDWVVEIGPGAGDFGGQLLFNGIYEDFVKADTLTSDYVTGRRQVKAFFEHQPSGNIVRINKASKHNLANIDVSIRLGSFTIITGPSGAGKTTLMFHTLFGFLNDKQKFTQSYIRLQLLKQGLSRSEIIAAPVMKKDVYEHLENLATQKFFEHIGVESIRGHEMVKNTMYVDQSSIGKTPRSCPATFIGTFDHIRKIFAGTTEAKYIGFNTGHFSFNSSKGACPECDGYGYKKIELQFLPDTYVPCPLCHGKRYKSEVLEIKRHGKSIADILDMYIKDAAVFFEDMEFIADELQLLCDIGLGYLKLGQPAQMLSGGESQRLKLVKHLLKQYKGQTMYFLDEPTVGLHPHDIERLLSVLKRFLDKGDTILMIEHDESLLSFADDVIRLDQGKLVEGGK